MPAPRSCLRCNCILAFDNKDTYCSPCQRACMDEIHATVVPKPGGWKMGRGVRASQRPAAPLRRVIQGHVRALNRPGSQRQHEQGLTLLSRLYAERFGGQAITVERRLHRIMAGQQWVDRYFADEVCVVLREDMYLDLDLEEGA